MDLSKLRKSITKNIPGVSVGFSDPVFWVSTGNYGLNYRISGSFFKGVPLGKTTVFAGESGSGKSYICSGNMVREALTKGWQVILFDTENSIDRAWLEKLGVNVDDENLLRIGVNKIDEITKIIGDFSNDYIKEYRDLDVYERPNVLFVIDSLGMMMTQSEIDQFMKGDLKGDMGLKAKAVKALMKGCNNLFCENIGLVCTNHTYESQDMFDPDPKISGGQGQVYASSIVIAMKKLKLKEDQDGRKISEITGIRARCKVLKTRFTKPFEEVTIKIPYETGMDPYSGLFDIFLKEGILSKEGNRYAYIDKNGEKHLLYEREYNMNTDGILDLIMKEHPSNVDVQETQK